METLTKLSSQPVLATDPESQTLQLSGLTCGECDRRWIAFLRATNEFLRIKKLNFKGPDLAAAEAARAEALHALNLHQIEFGHPELEGVIGDAGEVAA